MKKGIWIKPLKISLLIANSKILNWIKPLLFADLILLVSAISKKLTISTHILT